MKTLKKKIPLISIGTVIPVNVNCSYIVTPLHCCRTVSEKCQEGQSTGRPWPGVKPHLSLEGQVKSVCPKVQKLLIFQ